MTFLLFLFHLTTIRSILLSSTIQMARVMKTEERFSRNLSKILRHQALSRGLAMEPDGFVQVSELLELSEFKRKLSYEELRSIVRSNDKQRFELVEELEGSVAGAKIRAVQGHTIREVDDELLLKEITSVEELGTAMIIHGTYRPALATIMENGLKRMSRNHIHCASGYPGADEVISGMRKSAHIAFVMDPAKCLEHGVKILLSRNGVILLKGIDEEGTVPPACFKEVIALDGKPL